MYAVGAGLSSFFAVFLHHLFKQKGGRRRCVGNGIGRWEAYGDYGNGSSYGRRGTHYVCGHYSRDNGSLVHRLEDMMQTADARDRDLLRRCIDELKR